MEEKKTRKQEIEARKLEIKSEVESTEDLEKVEELNKEVEALYMTHHTKSDGLTYYLKKNTPKCICISLPYDKCIEAEKKLKHNKIFFVENYKQLKNLSVLI